MRLSSSSLAGSEIRPGSCARATNLWGRSVRLFQALCLLVIPEAFAAPMVVAHRKGKKSRGAVGFFFF